MSSVSQPDLPDQAKALNSTIPANNGWELIKNYSGEKTALFSFIVHPTSFTHQKHQNNMLLKMFVKDMQPFSIVEDQGFKDFISAIDTSYKLPHRKMITRKLFVYSREI